MSKPTYVIEDIGAMLSRAPVDQRQIRIQTPPVAKAGLLGSTAMMEDKR